MESLAKTDASRKLLQPYYKSSQTGMPQKHRLTQIHSKLYWY